MDLNRGCVWFWWLLLLLLLVWYFEFGFGVVVLVYCLVELLVGFFELVLSG